MPRYKALQPLYVNSTRYAEGAVFNCDLTLAADMAVPCDEHGRRLDVAGLQAEQADVARRLQQAQSALAAPKPAPKPAPEDDTEISFDLGGEEPEDPKPKPKKR